ncbi:MAG TPA: hypothetical protein VHL30_04490 [Chlamydiales bacterium]|jgi:hypothetical protein|nr:hypothetical protein [Chlamydiales bacterium]
MASRIEINNHAQLSGDGRTILKALTIDGISYDIDIDFSNRASVCEDLQLIPKIQTIWARMAEQALPDSLPANWQMECSYNSHSQKASVIVISAGKKKDRTDTISLPARELKEDLREAEQFIIDYATRDMHCTAKSVMQYVDFLMNRASYCYDQNTTTLSKRIRKGHAVDQSPPSSPESFPFEDFSS